MAVKTEPGLQTFAAIITAVLIRAVVFYYVFFCIKAVDFRHRMRYIKR